jgi:hypothetical protein
MLVIALANFMTGKLPTFDYRSVSRPVFCIDQKTVNTRTAGCSIPLLDELSYL